MAKLIPISEYDQLKDHELIAEVQQRRREIQKPKLDWKDHLSNFLASTSVIGFGIASTVGVLMNIRKPAEGGFSDSLNDLYDSQSRKKYIDGKKNFKRTLYTATGIFTIASLITAPIINYFQKGERAEDNATKYVFGKDELFKRGYVQTRTGDFVKMHTSAEVREEQQRLLHRVDELEKTNIFQDRESVKKLAKATDNSPSVS
ncbi:MAG: hypothetical protein P8P30_08970 [Rickettsiales bacterium]|nr:hypothetical protein [Rickettsiales bacterium]